MIFRCRILRPQFCGSHIPNDGHHRHRISSRLMWKSKAGAWGFIIREHDGTAVLVGAGNLGPMHDALIAETMACKQALEAAEQFGISQIELETDSSQLKDALTSSSRDMSIGGGLFTNLRSFLHDSFNCISVLDIPRSCNSVSARAC